MRWFSDYEGRLRLSWILGSVVVGFFLTLFSYSVGRSAGLKDALEVELHNQPKFSAIKMDPDLERKTSFEPISPGWYVLVTMDKNLDTIVRLRDMLVENGFGASVETLTISNVTFYRLYAGPETTKDLAEKLLAELKRENYLPFDMRVTYVRQLF